MYGNSGYGDNFRNIFEEIVVQGYTDNCKKFCVDAFLSENFINGGMRAVDFQLKPFDGSPLTLELLFNHFSDVYFHSPKSLQSDGLLFQT